MGGYIGKKLVKEMIRLGKNIMGARVLVMGITFKEDVADIRNSKVVDIINELVDYGVSVDIVDPHANAAEVKHEYGLDMIATPQPHTYDAVIVAVSHKDYLTLDETYFQTLTTPQAVLADVKGLYRGRIHTLIYWSL
jgi:UDP-N-acetyl-D-galactosamine dehydrogenase